MTSSPMVSSELYFCPVGAYPMTGRLPSSPKCRRTSERFISPYIFSQQKILITSTLWFSDSNIPERKSVKQLNTQSGALGLYQLCVGRKDNIKFLFAYLFHAQDLLIGDFERLIEGVRVVDCPLLGFGANPAGDKQLQSGQTIEFGVEPFETDKVNRGIACEEKMH